jgi:hypothetical protein
VITYEPYLKKITGLPSTPSERDDEIEIWKNTQIQLVNLNPSNWTLHTCHSDLYHLSLIRSVCEKALCQTSHSFSTSISLYSSSKFKCSMRPTIMSTLFQIEFTLGKEKHQCANLKYKR